MSILCHYRSGTLGGMAAFGPHVSTFKGDCSPPPVKTICVIIYRIWLRYLHRLFTRKGMKIHPCIEKLHRGCQQNVPESESRQFDWLWLLVRCHDSGWIRLQLRLRLRTPGFSTGYRITDPIRKTYYPLETVITNAIGCRATWPGMVTWGDVGSKFLGNLWEGHLYCKNDGPVRNRFSPIRGNRGGGGVSASVLAVWRTGIRTWDLSHDPNFRLKGVAQVSYCWNS